MADNIHKKALSGKLLTMKVNSQGHSVHGDAKDSSKKVKNWNHVSALLFPSLPLYKHCRSLTPFCACYI